MTKSPRVTKRPAFHLPWLAVEHGEYWLGKVDDASYAWIGVHPHHGYLLQSWPLPIGRIPPANVMASRQFAFFLYQDLPGWPATGVDPEAIENLSDLLGMVAKYAPVAPGPPVMTPVLDILCRTRGVGEGVWLSAKYGLLRKLKDKDQTKELLVEEVPELEPLSRMLVSPEAMVGWSKPVEAPQLHTVVFLDNPTGPRS